MSSVRYLCSFCSRSFSDPNSRNCHEGTHVDPNVNIMALEGSSSAANSIHKCSFCFQVFANASSKLNHEKTHLGEGPYECSHCSELFFDLSEKRRHEMCHTIDRRRMDRRRSEVGPVKGLLPTLPAVNCVTRAEWINIQFQSECVTASPCQQAVREDYVCHVCNRRFPDAPALNQHEKLHSRPVLFRCSYCPKTFSRLCHKNSHESGHVREQTFSCSFCPMKFSMQGEKTNHEVIHSNFGSHQVGPARGFLTPKNEVMDESDAWGSVSAPTTQPPDSFGEMVVKDEPGLDITDVRTCRAVESSAMPVDALQSEVVEVDEQPVECRSCEKTFEDISSENTHGNSHSKDVRARCKKSGKIWKCAWCPRVFNRACHRGNHEKWHRLDTKNLVRSEVKTVKAEPNINSILSSLTKQLGEGDQYLSFRKTGQRQTFKAAMAKFRERRSFQCSYCPRTFELESSRAKHEVVHSKDTTFRCSYCPRLFKRRGNQKNHEKVHSDVDKENSVMCRSLPKVRRFGNVLEEATQNSEEILRPQPDPVDREMEVKSEVDKPFNCDFCSRTFRRIGYQRQHVRHIHGSEMLSAMISQNIDFPQTESGKEERSVVVGKTDSATDKKDNGLKCSYCPRLFSKPKYRRIHELSHTVVGTFKCHLCPRVFKRSSFLKIHLHTHNRSLGASENHSVDVGQADTETDKQYNRLKCPYCPRLFLKYQHRRIHELSHTVVGTFKCHLCPRIFKRSSFLKVHLHTHNRLVGTSIDKASGRVTKRRRRRIYVGFRRRRRRKMANEQIEPANKGAAVQEPLDEEQNVNPPNPSLEEVNEEFSTSQTVTANETDSSFTCYICAKTFSKHSSLLKHKRYHYKKSTVACPICQKNFNSVTSMLKHKSYHYKKDAISCALCQKTFNSVTSMLKHKNYHYKKGTVSCPVCQKIFNSVVSMLKHKINHDKKEKLTCSICSKRFNKHASMLKHRRWHERQGIDCPVSQKTEEIKPSMMKVRNYQDETDKVNCPVCQKIFSSVSSMLKHKFYHEDQEEADCTVCGKRFKSKSAMLKHKFYHRPGASCRICRIKFDSKSAMLKHRRNAHKKKLTPGEVYRCSRCTKTFSKHGQLAIHERFHSARKRLKCSYCPRLFALPCHKTSHEQGHTNVRSIKCSCCPQLFANHRYKFIHERKIHGLDVGGKGDRMSKIKKRSVTDKVMETSGDDQSVKKQNDPQDGSLARSRTYKCNVCTQIFPYYRLKRNHELKEHGVGIYNQLTRKRKAKTTGMKGQDLVSSEHERSVEKAKNHLKCSVCDRTFNLRCHQINHELSHNIFRSYKCKFCPRSFSRARFLRMHERQHNRAYKRISKVVGPRAVVPETSGDVERDRSKSAQDGRLFNCTFCSEKFVTLALKYQHEQVHLRKENGNDAERAHGSGSVNHDGPPKRLKTFHCFFCAQTFRSDYQRRKHQKIHYTQQ